ncbi:prefoldin subunit [Nesidiocoris tenuis]|uniref:Prefoldin subunit n=1 Tax=Nesidiocoris tenuis TaxID=355587 RepID=A0ABN7ASY2_9HEMI|nr:prefoldin subunit [Nesidiocoris tenuis]
MSSKKEPELQQIELIKLSLPNLTQLKKQLDQEISLFQESMQTLKIAQTKYSDSQEALKKISPEVKDTRIMVPLTGSMFVRGTFKDTKRVLVDVGTGYYLKIGMDDARDFFKRKVAFVTEQMEKIQKLGMERSKAREAVMAVMEAKIAAQINSQKTVAAT